MIDILSRRLLYDAFLYRVGRKRSKIIVKVNSQKNLFVLRTEKSSLSRYIDCSSTRRSFSR